MGDFLQNGLVTTLHNLRNRSVKDLEAQLTEFSKTRPVSLIIPCLYSELDGPALPRILDELENVPYLNEIIIGLDRANREEFYGAVEYFSRLPQHHRLLWNDGPRLRA
ncbi:MAG: glycosyl transferase, partial [Bacteroidota bacterium]